MQAVLTSLLLAVLSGQAEVDGRQGIEAACGMRVLGVSVIAAGKHDETIRPFLGQRAGTEVGLLVRSRTAPLVRVDSAQSRIRLTDDSGQTLRALDATAGQPRVAGLQTVINTKRDACLVRVHSPGIPGPATSAVRLQGALVLYVAEKTRTVRRERVEFVHGTVLRFGDCEIELLDLTKARLIRFAGLLGWTYHRAPERDSARPADLPTFVLGVRGGRGMDQVTDMRFAASGSDETFEPMSMQREQTADRTGTMFVFWFRRRFYKGTIHLTVCDRPRRRDARMDLSVRLGAFAGDGPVAR